MYLTDKNFLKNNTSLFHFHTKTLRNKPDEKNMFSLASPECASTQPGLGRQAPCCTAEVKKDMSKYTVVSTKFIEHFSVDF